MIAPPKMLAAAAVRPSRTLVRMGFMGRQPGSYQLHLPISPRRHRVTEKSNDFSLLRASLVKELARVPNVHHVTILYDVVLAFQAQRAFGAGIGFRAGFEKLVPA